MPCLLCGDPGPLERKHTIKKYVFAVCPTCGLLQLDPLPSPTEIAAIYEGDYFRNAAEHGGYDNYANQAAEYDATFREEIQRLSAWKTSGAVLDVGCGFGYFMRVATDAGFDVYGIDLSGEAVKVTSKAFPEKVACGGIEAGGELGCGKFSAIMMSHLIEHVPAPVSYMKSARDLLEDEGILVLLTPNAGSLLARVSGARWVSLKVPEHVCIYTPQTIRMLLEKAGFDVLSIESTCQHYRVSFAAERVRRLISPLDRLVPRIERSKILGERIVRIPNGSMRVIARKKRI